MFNWLKNIMGKSAVTEPTTFMDENEIVNDLIRRMSEDDVRSWRKYKKEDMILGHHSTGRSIRNEYHLWHSENPHTDGNDPNGDNHPDQMSHRIMEKVWTVLNA